MSGLILRLIPERHPGWNSKRISGKISEILPVISRGNAREVLRKTYGRIPTS